MARSSFPAFGERLRGLFKARGITNQSAFAREHNFNQSKISRWLRGSVPESEEDINRLAHILGTTSGELLTGRGAPPAAPVVAVPADIRDIMQELCQAQAQLLTRAVEALWTRSLSVSQGRLGANTPSAARQPPRCNRKPPRRPTPPRDRRGGGGTTCPVIDMERWRPRAPR